jgi:hypothetical protein
MLDQSNISIQRCQLIFYRMQCWWLFGFGKDYKLGTGCKDTLVICNSIFFHISEPNKGTKGPENHSLG